MNKVNKDRREIERESIRFMSEPSGFTVVNKHKKILSQESNGSDLSCDDKHLKNLRLVS